MWRSNELRSQRFIVALLGVATLLGAPTAARAANPSSAVYSRDGNAIFWIVHISDTHIGATSFEGPNASAHLAWVLGEGLDTIAPSLVVVTGDLCDGSNNDIPASGQDQGEWDEYHQIVTTAGMTAGYYLDLPGNHDGYNNPDLTFYLANSINGVDQGVPYREILLSFPFGDYLIFGNNTAGDGSGAFWEDPAFLADNVTALEASLQAHPAANLALLFGHHPISTPDGSAEVISLAQQHEAFWFHGHVHNYESYLGDGIINAQVDNLGKGDTDNVAVIAVDNNALAYAATSTSDPWPFVVVTAPADRLLDDGAANPYAYTVCNTGSDNPVRALVFDSDPVTSVSFTADNGSPVAMTQDANEPRLWHGSWDTTGLPAGETTLTVTAQGSATGSHAVSVMLGDVPCPSAVEPTPDAGVPADADLPLPDASTSSPDAGDPPPSSDDGGCNCRTRGPAGLPALPLLLALLFLMRRRLRLSPR